MAVQDLSTDNLLREIALRYSLGVAGYPQVGSVENLDLLRAGVDELASRAEKDVPPLKIKHAYWNAGVELTEELLAAHLADPSKSLPVKAA